MSKRGNGEGSIYPHGNGYAAYVWVTTPAGVKKRKYVYGPTREVVHGKWLDLHQAAARGAVETKSKTVEQYLHAWLEEVIRPNREPKTYDGYERFIRLHIVPWLGKKKLDRLSARDIQQWANKLATVCQCCQQGVDELRTPHKCCAKGKCCRKALSARSISDARTVLRSALSQAVTDELVSVNRAMQIRLPSGRKRRKKSWGTDEARRFLEHVRPDPHYAAYLLVLAMGLRKGEVLGLTWDSLDLDEGVLEPQWQLQRVMGELIHKRKAKTEESENALPMPDLCVKALRERRERQLRDRAKADVWHDSDLVFTTRYGTAIEPRNFHRYFVNHLEAAGLPRISVHDARRTCSSLLVDLDVHPRVIMAIMRHSDFKMTMEVYAQASDKATREALRKLSESFESED
ncbi:site-specific integrase [Glycomyces tritici]|uniref:Site-specific integrase n=1 Tax=Glycomyces tritici TaxID=2665176 RepID=A0ABT7YYH3_9ACTN|nr:site-specific integrase [Glycomyces tritici]MDN3241832.1 site-specific integrase [Glycomyces tritici]MDN3243699.1 site-specific integrase [Glycomyces tritici]